MGRRLAATLSNDSFYIPVFAFCLSFLFCFVEPYDVRVVRSILDVIVGVNLSVVWGRNNLSSHRSSNTVTTWRSRDLRAYYKGFIETSTNEDDLMNQDNTNDTVIVLQRYRLQTYAI